MAQAVIKYLKNQWIQRDNISHPFFAGIWGIFGHGNVAGIGQALEQDKEFRYYQARNEQAMVHAAAAFAKQNRRLKTFACTTSIGPGATNMITAAAGATINRIPVLLLPGDTFSKRNVGPVLQQLEHPLGHDISVNDCFRPISKYWDRIHRPEQILSSLPEALRILVSPSETGSVTLSLPQDVQAEAYDYPSSFFEKHVHYILRQKPDDNFIYKAAQMIQKSKRPLIIAGGGVLYSHAEEALSQFCQLTKIPSAETQAGKGSLAWKHPLNLGAIGVTGTKAANLVAREADLVIAVGTRLSDFTTASKTLFQNEDVQFININVCDFDAKKHSALPVIADAKITLEALLLYLKDYHTANTYQQYIYSLIEQWREEEEKIFNKNHSPISQGEVIGIITSQMKDDDTVVAAAGSLPGDMHKLWRCKNSGQYHLEYGYSCMGYEIAGGLGIKMAKDSGEVIVMVGDGSYLMMHTEILTSIQEHKKLIIILIENHAFNSIHGLSLACGSKGFGNQFRQRDTRSQHLDGENLIVDFAANAKSYGANSIKVKTKEELLLAFQNAKKETITSVIVIEVDPDLRVPSYESWWDVPIAEVSDMLSVNEVRKNYEQALKKERHFV